MIKIDSNGFYTIEDLMAMFSTTRAALSKLMKSGRLPKTRLGKHYRWPGSVILRAFDFCTCTEPNTGDNQKWCHTCQKPTFKGGATTK